MCRSRNSQPPVDRVAGRPVVWLRFARMGCLVGRAGGRARVAGHYGRLCLFLERRVDVWLRFAKCISSNRTGFRFPGFAARKRPRGWRELSVRADLQSGPERSMWGFAIPVRVATLESPPVRMLIGFVSQNSFCGSDLGSFRKNICGVVGAAA